MARLVARHDGAELPFPAILDLPAGRPRRHVVLVHGLGEGRVGTNYLLRDVARALAAAGHAATRFDLGGCGDSVLPMNMGVWRAQLAAAVDAATEDAHGNGAAVVARGSGAAVAAGHNAARRIILGPPDSAIFDDARQAIVSGSGADGWCRPPADPEPREAAFWANLGVELAVIGGLEVPVALLDDVRAALPSATRDAAVFDEPGDRGLLLERSRAAAVAATLEALE